MNPQPNFYILNRSILDHPFLTKNRHWQLAFIHVVGRASFETGRVNLTECYRELSDMFQTHSKWRSFIHAMIREGMLDDDIESVNLGKGKGFQQSAVITNYFKYQGVKKGAESAQCKSSESAVQKPVIAEPQGVSAQCKSSESAVSLKELKELKEIQTNNKTTLTTNLTSDSASHAKQFLCEIFLKHNKILKSIANPSKPSLEVDTKLDFWLKRFPKDELATLVRKATVSAQKDENYNGGKGKKRGFVSVLRHLEELASDYDQTQEDLKAYAKYERFAKIWQTEKLEHWANFPFKLKILELGNAVETHLTHYTLEQLELEVAAAINGMKTESWTQKHPATLGNAFNRIGKYTSTQPTNEIKTYPAGTRILLNGEEAEISIMNQKILMTTDGLRFDPSSVTIEVLS